MKSFVVGNWKMNGRKADLSHVAMLDFHPETTVVICPPATLLSNARAAIQHNATPLAFGGQDCHPEPAGAYTGDLSAAMLKDAGAAYVIVGHSERRVAYNETDVIVRKKVIAAFKNDLIPIICIGETLHERESNLTGDVLKKQIENSVPVEFPEKPFLIAYEPIWAIGTGKTPSESEISRLNDEICANLSVRLTPEKAQNVPVLYGGSVNAENASRLAVIKTISGVLVGGASLDPAAFNAIIQAFEGRKK